MTFKKQIWIYTQTLKQEQRKSKDKQQKNKKLCTVVNQILKDQKRAQLGITLQSSIEDKISMDTT